MRAKRLATKSSVTVATLVTSHITLPALAVRQADITYPRLLDAPAPRS